MRKKYLLYLFILAISFYSCNTGNDMKGNTDTTPPSSELADNSNVPKNEWRFDSLTVDKTFHVDNDTSKLGISVNIYIKYPTLAPSNVNLDNVQKTFARIFSKEDSETGTPIEVFNEILKKKTAEALDNIKGSEDDITYFADYEFNLGNGIDYISDGLITTSTVYYTYLGGAHGSSHIQYFNIDTHNGDIITEKQLFKVNYKEKLASIIQNTITKLNSSPNEDDHLYLLVELDEVGPNNNFYFSKDGLVYLYNQYEITPYVQGMPEITLPYNEVTPIIKDQYQYIIKNITGK